MKHYLAELHIHTTCSDGWMKPEHIPRLAKKKGLDIVAVTDHNNIEGGIRTKSARLRDDPYVIPGIEVSTKDDCHIVGLYVNKDIPYLKLTAAQVIKEFGDHQRFPPHRSYANIFDCIFRVDDKRKDCIK